MKKYLSVSLITIMVFGISACSLESNAADEYGSGSEDFLFPVKSISHAHGLAVDIADRSKLYIATHNGLLLLHNKTDLYRIGLPQDDFMGFTVHPLKAQTFFSSGHPKGGGNLGIQRSDDGGLSWRKISDGLSGPVDFHSMTVSPKNPDLFYGWYGALQRSTDGGIRWEFMRSELQNVISLVADPHDENVVYATTASGMQWSVNKGETWISFSQELIKGVTIAFAVDPFKKGNMLSFSRGLGLSVSANAGKTWNKVSEDVGIILYFAFDPITKNSVYAMNSKNRIFHSTDGGLKWSSIY